MSKNETAQEVCDRYEMRVAMIKYKDKSTTIHISKEASFKDVTRLVMELFGGAEYE